MDNNDITYLFGSEKIEAIPDIPYGKKACVFLEELSKALKRDDEAKKYPDIQTFAFWIRKANIQKLKQSQSDSFKRLGRGLVFHIAPSNVPINFAYTLVFGILSGNSNVIRVSSKKFVTVDIICRILEELTKKEDLRWVYSQNAIISYDKTDSAVTDYFSSICDVRVIWGGDRTIDEIRKSPLPPRGTEITFADRYSFAILSINAIEEASDEDIMFLARRFYNDTYLMDQNACSSPHFVFWVGDIHQSERAENRFWDAVFKCAKQYDLSDIKVSEKYTLLCDYATKCEISSVYKYENLLYVINLKKIDKSITCFRGKFGVFFSLSLDSIENIKNYIDDNKIQTCVVYGINPEHIRELIQKKNLKGIDRVVSVGNALDMDVFWDGYDVIGSLSRCIL